MARRLMVVDDEKMALQVLKDLLEPVGNEVVEFTDIAIRDREAIQGYIVSRLQA